MIQISLFCELLLGMHGNIFTKFVKKKNENGTWYKQAIIVTINITILFHFIDTKLIVNEASTD